MTARNRNHPHGEATFSTKKLGAPIDESPVSPLASSTSRIRNLHKILKKNQNPPLEHFKIKVAFRITLEERPILQVKIFEVCIDDSPKYPHAKISLWDSQYARKCRKIKVNGKLKTVSCFGVNCGSKK